ncbi:MAG: hypothetical protein MJ234_06060 [bacterium]|nr:hypothetical protein [bacterium]
MIKKTKQYGVSLIETVIALWLLGITVLSVMTVGVGNFAKKNQYNLEAVALLKSEYQSCIDIIQNKCRKPVPRISLIPINAFIKESGGKFEATQFKKIIFEDHGYGNIQSYIDDESLSEATILGEQIIMAKSAQTSGISYDTVKRITEADTDNDVYANGILANFESIGEQAGMFLYGKSSHDKFEGSDLFIIRTDFYRYVQSSDGIPVKQLISENDKISRGETINAELRAIFLTSSNDNGKQKKLAGIAQTADITVFSDLSPSNIRIIDKN